MSSWEYILLFGSVVLGGGIALVFPIKTRQTLQLVLSFSGAYILGIIVLHLMPSVFSGSNPQTAGLWVLGGFFAQIILEQLSAGLEHGHIHAPHKITIGFVVSVLLGLSVHAFIEGMPLSYYKSYLESHAHAHHSGHVHYLIGIILHHIPAAFALVNLLLLSSLDKRWVWCCLLIFSAMSPSGAFLAGSISISSQFQTGILAFAMGSLLHIATVILFEMDGSSHMHLSVKRLVAILLGIGASLLTLL